MHPIVLKELSTELAKPLFILFRKPLEYEQTPTAWKESQIIPIFKKGDKSSVSNYCPVSLTSLPGSDGILAENLKYAINGKIVDYLSVMFTIRIN